MKRVTVGLTGGIGSGKTTVGILLAELGAEVVSGDQLGREVIEGNPEVRRELISELGREIDRGDGALDRAKIAELVFGDPVRSAWLTSLTFPHIYAKWRHLRDESNSKAIVFDAALLFEWKIEREFDVLLVVHAPDDLVLTRARGRFSSVDLRNRAQRQVPVHVKAAAATHTIVNDGDQSELKQKVEEFWKKHIAPRCA